MYSLRDRLSAIRDPVDRAALRAANLSSLDAVWAKIGEDVDEGVDVLVRKTQWQADRRRLIADLTQAAREERNKRGLPWPRRHGLDLLLLSGLVLFICMAARAGRESASVAIALHDMKSGETLNADKLHGADDLDLVGRGNGPRLRVAHDVSEGDFLFHKDIERLEVVALRVLEKGKPISTDDVRLEWKLYSEESAATLDEVLGNLPTRSVTNGETVRANWVETDPVLVDQVIVTRRLPRFRRLTEADLRLAKRPRQPDTVLSIDEAVGHYLLQEVTRGAVLSRKDLSQGVLDSDDLRGRQLLTIRVQPPSFRLAAALPARLSLAVSSVGSNGRKPGTLLLREVPILAVDATHDGPSVVAVMSVSEIQDLLPLLPDSQVFVLQPPS